MFIDQRTFSLDEYHAFCELPENRDRLFELVDGHVVGKSSDFIPSEIALIVAHLVKDWLDQNPIGRVSGADGTYILSPEHEFMPDVDYISKVRMPDKPPRQVLMAPDLAVEVKSPTDTIRKMREKVEIYLAHGTQIVWLVFPDTQRVEVYTPDGEILDVGMDDELTGGTVLPGFTLALRKIFVE
jgi:Uma2 family endonuclease